MQAKKKWVLALLIGIPLVCCLMVLVVAVLVLLVSVSARRPLDFSVFPTVLLVATLMRLSLNVASTRVVLLHGHEGHEAAGKVIQAFGEVVIGAGRVLAEGTVSDVAGGRRNLQDAFVELVGGRDLEEGELSWLSSSSD